MKIKNLQKVEELAGLREYYLERFKALRDMDFEGVSFLGPTTTSASQERTVFGVMPSTVIKQMAVDLEEDEVGTMRKFFKQYLLDQVSLVDLELYDLGVEFDVDYINSVKDLVGRQDHNQLDLDLDNPNTSTTYHTTITNPCAEIDLNGFYSPLK